MSASCGDKAVWPPGLDKRARHLSAYLQYYVGFVLINCKEIAEDGHPPESAKDADRTSRIARLLKCHFERINGGKLEAIATCLCVIFGELSCSVRSEERIATILS